VTINALKKPNQKLKREEKETKLNILPQILVSVLPYTRFNGTRSSGIRYRDSRRQPSSLKHISTLFN
jgi:hypothetical protein